MPRHKLTDRWISSCPLPARGRYEHSDLICPGLYLRVTSTGVKSFSVLIRRGRLERRTLGRYPVLGLAEARRAAMELMRQLAEEGAQDVAGVAGQGGAVADAAGAAGQGGAAAGAAAAAGAVVAADPEAPTLADIVTSYVELHLKRNVRGWRGVQSTLSQPALAHLSGLAASAVTKRDVVAVLDALVAAGKPHAGVNLLKAMKALYNWAVDRDLVAESPCVRVRPPVRTTERSRILTDAEIVAVLGACGAVPAPFGDVVRMLLYTGARRNEVAQMRWPELEGNVWTLPAARSKSGRANSLTLPPAAMAVLAALPRHGGTGYVFTTTGGRLPSSDYAKRKRLLDQASGTGGWHLHDLRRTVRSKLSQLGVPRDVARRIVGHAADKLDQIYDLHSFASEKAEGLALLAEHVDGLVRAG